ncbi:hypothetical protein HY491_03460 [Candidatus Woesearchaeota archaeon]|nr:hypothetical protein [Candidatus Woesearchaeota archaeon]
MGQKRGSLSLSVNAIVVLVLAVIIMSFAITFIQKYLREAEVGISAQFPELEVPVNAENPIGIGNNFLIKAGEERKLTLNVYNNKGSAVTTTQRNVLFDCGTGISVPKTTDVEPKTIESSQTEKVRVVIEGAQNMPNNKICKITVGSIEQSFFLVTK